MVKTQDRKEEHLNLCLTKDVEFKKKTGFEKIELVHQALPQMSFEDVDTSIEFLGKKVTFPLIISSITGGCPSAKTINKELAAFAHKHGLMFSVGSMRSMIEDKKMKETYAVRDIAPDVVFLGNIGIGQLRKLENSQILSSMESLGVDGFYVHINAAQELLQKGGDIKWEGCLERLRELCKESKYPVLVKEVGNGISMETARKLDSLKIYAIDVAGAGGSSWTKVEFLRTGIGENFCEWGIPTLQSLVEVKRATSKKVIASGGIRTGQDIAKAIAIGADACGIALPFLKAQKDKSLNDYFAKISFDLRASMFLTGARTIQDLKHVRTYGL
jgi:isopentenyl-diphosphate delta-isomerase